MKIKNILKIGIFSIVILSLFISPILKFITPETKAFTLWSSWGTSTTGLNFEDYLSTCTSSAANNTITNNPTAYTILCCNDEDHNYAVRNSSSYDTIVTNCETAKKNASSQGIPEFDENWCSNLLNFDSSNIDKTSDYMEKCCKSGDQATGELAAVAQKQIDNLCQKAESTLNTYLLTTAVIEQETDIKYCVVENYDAENTTIVTLYSDNQIYIDKCCNLTEVQINSLTDSEKDLLSQRCIWAAKSDETDIFTGEPKSQIKPITDPELLAELAASKTPGYREIPMKTSESPADQICGTEERLWLFNAGNIDWWQHKVCLLQVGIIEGLGRMFSGLINTGITMTLWAFNPRTYGGFIKNDAVLSVSKLMRNLINLSLVLTLVIIAITTILGIKKYSWQQTLWKLILVALLVNFSLVIAGVILDISNFFSYYFLNLAKLNNDDIASSMINGFKVEEFSGENKYKLALIDDETVITAKDWGLSWGQFLLISSSLTIIGLFAFISLLAICASMFVRSFMILALLCLSSFAFAAWILPDTEKYWKMWWQQFIKWCTFPIIFGLMLYIGLLALNTLEVATIAYNSAHAGTIAFIIRILLFSMFLVGGLIFSVQGGGAVAQFVMKQAGKIGLAIKSAVGGVVVGGIQRSKSYRAVGQKLTQIPVFNAVGYKMLDQSDRARFTNIRKIEKDMENWKPGDILKLADGKAPSPMNRESYAHYMAAVRIATRKGWLKNDSAALDHIRTHLDDPDFNAKEVVNSLPQYFKIVNGQLEAINTQGQDYMNDLVEHIASLSSEDLSQNHHRERIFQAAQERKVDRAKFIQQLTKRLTPSQQVALYGNIDPETWNNAQEPWGGNGVVAQAVKGTPEEATLNTKIAASRRLEEVLGITPTKDTQTPPVTTSTTPAATTRPLRTPAGDECIWNSSSKCWTDPYNGEHPHPIGSPPDTTKYYWSTKSGKWVIS